MFLKKASLCALQVNGNTVQQVVQFKHFGWYSRVTEVGTKRWNADC